MPRFRKRYFVRQHDAMLCGVACLSMLCRTLGVKLSQSYLSTLCSATIEGVSMKGISDAATQIGLKSCGARLTFDELEASPRPCILHWNQNHFVLLTNISRGKIQVADPAKCVYTLNKSEFLSHWLSTSNGGQDKGIAMFFESGTDFGKNLPEEQHKENYSFKILLQYLGLYRKYLVQIFLGMFLGCILELILPFLTQGIVDYGIANKDIGLVGLILLGELMIVTGRTATDFIRRWLLLHISMRVNISLVSDFFIKLLKLPMPFFDAKQLGDILQRVGDHSRVQSFLTQQTLSIVFSLISFVVFSFVLLSYDLLIFIVFIVGSIIYGVWISIFLKKRKELDYELFAKQANNQSKTFQFITAMQEIKLQNCEGRRRWEWEDIQADLFEVQLKNLKLQQTQEAGSIFINEIKNILLTVITATAVINGSMTLGAMLAVQYIIGQLNSPITQFMAFIYSVQDVRISLERINEIHKLEEEKHTNDDICPEDSDEGIMLNGLSFKYNRHAIVKTLDNINLYIPPGKTTAIVGASGSGKTTLIKMILGYYPPLEGNIDIGNRSLAEINLKWWRWKCGAIMQDGVIFSESIARNIATCDGEIDVNRLEYAARKACIHDYIVSLPLSYNTIIGMDGVGLSQGQKQRLLIARAIYKNPKYIFLDEATNALDASNERMIIENLKDFYRGKTVVVVAHRLSTVRDADNIAVLDKGRIVESGSHTELINKRGYYYELIKNQLELGI